jgi:ParB-like chromosome segregation protein Spo0J
MHNVAEALLPLLTPLDALTPHPQNARNGDLEAIVESLRSHGQYAPIVVQQSTGRVIKGNHVYASALALGWTHAAATLLDVDDDTATRILLVDNRTSDLGRYDDPMLAGLLSDLDGLHGTGFEERDLARLLARIEADEAEPLDGSEDTGGLGAEPVVSYALVFDSTLQQNRWYAYLKWLRQVYPGDTIGERLYDHLGTVLGGDQ